MNDIGSCSVRPLPPRGPLSQHYTIDCIDLADHLLTHWLHKCDPRNLVPFRATTPHGRSSFPTAGVHAEPRPRPVAMLGAGLRT